MMYKYERMMVKQPQDSEKHVRNLKLILSYDGSPFAGWQVQPGRATVQGTLAHAIGRLSGENVLPQDRAEPMRVSMRLPRWRALRRRRQFPSKTGPSL